jgi:hypothetical protein
MKCDFIGGETFSILFCELWGLSHSTVIFLSLKTSTSWEKRAVKFPTGALGRKGRHLIYILATATELPTGYYTTQGIWEPANAGEWVRVSARISVDLRFWHSHLKLLSQTYYHHKSENTFPSRNLLDIYDYYVHVLARMQGNNAGLTRFSNILRKFTMLSVHANTQWCECGLLHRDLNVCCWHLH